MYRIDRCPCCRERLDESCPALLAPFLAERVLGGSASACSLMTCPTCGLRCFDGRFDEMEMGRLYQGYREEDYYRVRHRWEPWYTSKVNAALSQDPAEMAARKTNVFRLISRTLEGASPGRILDFGGDQGQFIPDEWEAERFVFEISGRAPLPGIQSIEKRSDLEGACFDLVMLCHVLEHLSDPAAQMGILHSLIGPSGVLYVEVPQERPNLHWAGSWPWTRPGLHWLARHPWLLRLVDLYSTVFRIRRGTIPLGGFLKASEHINFFTVRSLDALMRRMGFQVLACEELAFQGAYCEAKVLGCVARRSSPSPQLGFMPGVHEACPGPPRHGL